MKTFKPIRPSIKITETYYNKCSSKVKNILMSLTINTPSGMRQTIRNNRKTKIYIAKQGNFILGWACHSFHPNFIWGGIGTIMVYVRKNYRKRGIGRVLLKYIHNKDVKIRVCGWTSGVYKYFKKINRRDRLRMKITKDYSEVCERQWAKPRFVCNVCGAIYSQNDLSKQSKYKWNVNLGLRVCGKKIKDLNCSAGYLNCAGHLIRKTDYEIKEIMEKR